MTIGSFVSSFSNYGSSIQNSLASATAGVSSAVGKAFGGAINLTGGLNEITGGGTSGVTRPQGRPEYGLVVQQAPSGSRPGRSLYAELPADFNFNLTAEWAAPFAEGIIHSDRLNMIAQMMGMKFSNQTFSSNFWTGSSDVSFSFPLTFVAETSYQDVLKPILTLVEMALPTIDPTSGFFRAPGPTIKASSDLQREVGDIIQTVRSFSPSQAISRLTGGTATPPANTNVGQVGSQPLSLAQSAVNKLKEEMQFEGLISLQIGTFLTIPSVVITSINKDFKVLIGPDGVPMQVTATVDFKTHQTPSAADIVSWYSLGALA